MPRDRGDYWSDSSETANGVNGNVTPQELLNAIWSGIVGFLQFEVFVALSALLVTYYLGAVVIPALLFIVFRRWTRSVGENTVSRPPISDLTVFVTER